jgi:hypothetical protein
MSRTEIYRLGREPQEIGLTRNAWRSAMYVWEDIAKRYFDIDGFFFNKDRHNEIWNAWKHHKMPQHEIIVLLSTMDKAVVRGEDRDALVAAFEQYSQEHPNSSLSEQAQIIKNADIQPGDFIAWRQTSVGEFWGSEWSEENEECVYYDPNKENEHFDVMAEARKILERQDDNKGSNKLSA